MAERSLWFSSVINQAADQRVNKKRKRILSSLDGCQDQKNWQRLVHLKATSQIGNNYEVKYRGNM